MKLEDIELKPGVQPDEMDFSLADGVFVKSGQFKLAGSVIPQHSHDYDHTSFIASGGVHAWCEGAYLGHFKAPASVFIKAKHKHTFMTTEDNTTVLCIHNISRNGLVDIHDLHELHFP